MSHTEMIVRAERDTLRLRQAGLPDPELSIFRKFVENKLYESAKLAKMIADLNSPKGPSAG